MLAWIWFWDLGSYWLTPISKFEAKMFELQWTVVIILLLAVGYLVFAGLSSRKR